MKKPDSAYKAIMLVDDSVIDNFINSKMIEGCNFATHIYIHTGAQSALEFLKNLENLGAQSLELVPEIIFLDLNMPTVDGIQFVEEYGKLDSGIKKKTKIVMLTTSENFEDIERAKQTGLIYKYVNKPLSQATLQLLKEQRS